MNRILTLLLLPALILPLYACGKQEAPAPKANVAAPAPATAKETVPASDDFYIKVDECYKELPHRRKKPYSAVVGLTGKWAVQDGDAWKQSIDINDDGLCDSAISNYFSYTIYEYNRDANGYPFELLLRIRPGEDKYIVERTETQIVDGKKRQVKIGRWDRALVKVTGSGGGRNDDLIVSSEDVHSLNDAYADQIEVPGGDNDRAIVLKIYPKAGGMPYILLPTYPLVAHGRSGIDFPEPQFDVKGQLVDMDPAEPDLDWGGWDIIRWDPSIKKFRNVLKRHDPIFSPENTEYWNVRAWLAERYLEDGLKAFKARGYSTAENWLELAADTDPRNLDILTWRAHFAYASGRFKEAAGFYDTIIQRDKYATDKPPLEQTYFNLGLSREAQCWEQLRDRNPGDPQGCSDEIFRKAQVAYQTYLKLAPIGERAAEVKKRLEDMRKGSFRQPVGDAELAASAQWLDKLAKVFVQASRGAARPEPRPVSSAETGQPQNTRQADPYTLTPSDLKKIDQEIARLLQKRGLRFEQSRIDWMIAYKAKFPDADLNDLIVRPEYYEAMPWVQAWRKTYSGLPK